MELIEYKSIKEKVAELRKTGERLISNYLPMFDVSDQKKFYGEIYNNTVIFFYKNDIVTRVVFSSISEDELVNILTKLPRGYAIDFFSNQKTIYDDFLSKSNFTKKALLQKLKFEDISMSENEIEKDTRLKELYKYRNDDIVEYAKEGDEKEIFCLLNEVFDKYIDHILTERDLLENYIKKSGVLVYRENGRILTIETFSITGNKMFLFSVINKSSFEKLCALDVKLRDIAKGKNIKYMYTYVNLYNDHAVRYHKRRNALFEKFYNHIYVNE